MAGKVGSTYDLDIVFYDIKGYVDLSEWDLQFWFFRLGEHDPSVILSLDSGLEFESDGTDGAFHLHLTSEQTETLGAGSIHLEIWKINDPEENTFLGEGHETFYPAGYAEDDFQ